ncbi:Conserved_hypothetical protein [Hexamita inflata]|uniref:Uncharacterized protein n=2 Tax=Hexamita inflata TaxID=28002 RepID=A0AA86UGC4_9EUKA|nr:Conserved hypothetical protein [Hexamita inflata]
MIMNENIQLTQKANNINLFIYTNVTQQSQIDVLVNQVEVNTFALFGFSINNQILIDSNIKIQIQFYVLTGALICTICDVDVQRCNIIFIASGQQISGMIIEPKESFKVQQSFIQFRISSMNSSGLTNIIKYPSIQYIINLCKLIGSNLMHSSNNGYIASTIFVTVQIQQFELYICIDKTERFGLNSVQINTIGMESVQCDICGNQSIVVYGLCGEVLKYSENVNGMYQCVYPFEYIDDTCVCAQGYLLNQTTCINLLETIYNISNKLNSSNNVLYVLQQQVDQIENSIIAVDQNILSNISELENMILSNYSQSEYNLQRNTSVLDKRIFDNISAVINNLKIADINLYSNTSVLDWRIFYNISLLQNIIHNMSSFFTDQLQNQSSIIDQQQNIIQNLTYQMNCNQLNGHQYKNGSCVLVSCSITGQQSINGICQCVNLNSIIYNNSCICPLNSQIIGIACVCSISGQTMQNGQCACTTIGAVVINGACSCGVNGINTSNTCSCPSGSSLVNGVCTCMNMNAYISGGQCVCPRYSSLIGNTCTCPSNSKIVNNECACSLIIGQIMNNGLCQCYTNGAFVSNGGCACGLNALNISNTCKCPDNSSLINNVCTCDKIIGQQIISGSCQCPSGQSVVSNSCQNQGTVPVFCKNLNQLCLIYNRGYSGMYVKCPDGQIFQNYDYHEEGGNAWNTCF